MTLKAFNEYLSKFNKDLDTDTYTRKDLYQIGKMYKQVNRKERNWDNLVKVLNIGQTGQNFRQWIYDQTKHNKFGLENDTEVSNDNLTEYEKLYIKQTQVRDASNAYRRSLRDEARISSFKATITDSVKLLANLPKVSYIGQKQANNTNEAVLLISDLHLGVDCNNLYNKFNEQIAAERLSKLVTDTIHYCKTMKVEKLNVLNLGDLVAGIIHPTIRLEQEFDVVEQVMKAAELIAECLNNLQQAAPIVTYRSVTDNHARVIANKNEHIEKENFCKIIDWFIEERLKHTNIKFMHDNVDDSMGKFTLLNGKKVMFEHGHCTRPNFALQAFMGATREWIDYIFMAHLHNPAEHNFQNCKVFTNGSIVGTDSYANEKRLYTEPTQKLVIFENNNVIDININLN